MRNYIEVYGEKKKKKEEVLMASLFYPEINKLSKSNEFRNVGPKYREEEMYPDGKIPETKPEKWVRRKKKLVRNKMKAKKKKKSRSLSPINIDELKKRVKKKEKKEQEKQENKSESGGSEEYKSKGKSTNNSESTKKSNMSTAKVSLTRKANKEMEGG